MMSFIAYFFILTFKCNPTLIYLLKEPIILNFSGTRSESGGPAASARPVAADETAALVISA